MNQSVSAGDDMDCLHYVWPEEAFRCRRYRQPMMMVNGPSPRSRPGHRVHVDPQHHRPKDHGGQGDVSNDARMRRTSTRRSTKGPLERVHRRERAGRLRDDGRLGQRAQAQPAMAGVHPGVRHEHRHDGQRSHQPRWPARGRPKCRSHVINAPVSLPASTGRQRLQVPILVLPVVYIAPTIPCTCSASRSSPGSRHRAVVISGENLPVSQAAKCRSDRSACPWEFQ